MKNTSEMYDMLIDLGIATPEEIALITAINGNNEETYNDILYVRCGYRSFEQMIELEEL